MKCSARRITSDLQKSRKTGVISCACCASERKISVEAALKIYGLKTCDTCRKALKTLQDAEFVDVRSQGVPEETLAAALAEFQSALVNTRSTTWRGLEAEERALEPMELLARHPTLMKRPLIEKDGRLYLGWTPKVQAALS